MTGGGVVGPRRAAQGRDRARWALGTAVLGRPAYINTGSAAELPVDRSVDAFRVNTWAVLDAAIAAGVDWIDTARSYGRAEEFVGQWWRSRAEADPSWLERAPTISSKWGYAYVGNWNPDAQVHELKEHSLRQFERQWDLTVQALPRLHLYQVHSLTTDSPLFQDISLLDALARVRDHGVAIGFSTSGPRQAETVHQGLEVTRGDAALFSAVQSTWNLLETSVGVALAEASLRELTVIVKEVLANGRLVTDPPDALRAIAERHHVGPDAVALAAAAAQPWANRVLLGPAGPTQLAQNLLADTLTLDHAELAAVTDLALDPAQYWGERSALPWR